MFTRDIKSLSNFQRALSGTCHWLVEDPDQRPVCFLTTNADLDHFTWFTDTWLRVREYGSPKDLVEVQIRLQKSNPQHGGDPTTCAYVFLPSTPKSVADVTVVHRHQRRPSTQHPSETMGKR